MITPLEERKQAGEYVNRVKHAEGGHSPNARDFSYEISEVSGERHGQRNPPHEFGEDTFEHSDGSGANGADAEAPEPDPRQSTSEDTTLDITI